MAHHTDDWCVDGIVKNHRIIRKLRGGSKTDSYLVEDQGGRRVMLTVLDTAKVMERYRFKAHTDGTAIGDVDAEARRLILKWQEEFKEMVGKIKGLGSDHVAMTYDIGVDQEKNQLIMLSEYVPGVDFYHATKGLEPIQMISLFVQALDGLHFIHKRGFLHLNVKPSRIRVDIEGTPAVVKFTDFGFAVPKQGYAGEYHGTSLYMAPEAIENRREAVDEGADLYSFGIMAYYCLTDHHPTEHRLEAQSRSQLAALVAREGVFSPPSHLNRHIPAELDRIIMQILEKDPDKRQWRTSYNLINEFYTIWPEESVKMPHEETSTLFE